ncbi:MAG: endo-1,4-beta-xylanase, partial [Phycisphaerae bacterium]
MKNYRKYYSLTAISKLFTAILLLCLFFGAMPAKAWQTAANQRIEQIRKRDTQITAVDSFGNPVPGISMQAEQISSHFKFGTCIANSPIRNNNIYRNFIINNFEWAVCENDTKWGANEPQRYNVTYANADYIYNWCNDNGIKMRGHTIFWEQLNSEFPDWVRNLSYATYPTPSDLLDAVNSRIDSAVAHFAGKYSDWDVNNEMLSDNFFASRLGIAGIAHMFNRSKAVNPSGGVYMNEYSGNSFGGYDSGPYVTKANQLIAQGATIDGFGIQAHLAENVAFDPQRYYNNVLEPLAVFGKPILATEFDASHTNATSSADNIENFLRICFSHPNVEGVIFWGFMEGQMWRNNAHHITSSGELTARGIRYQSLRNEWSTEHTDYMDIDGQVAFRGFHGTYEITLYSPGQPTEIHEIELLPGEGTATFIIQTDLSSPVPDETPPTPNPMTWASVPTATSSSKITMTATTATDSESPPVQYYFECTNDPSKSSSWQSSTTYIAEGLTPLTEYTFRVKARDSYLTPNETGWSGTASATTLEPPTNVEIIGDWATGTSHTKRSGYSRALVFIAHGESNTASTLTSVTYGGQAMTKIISVTTGTSGFRNQTEAFILDEAGIAAATSGTFNPTWSGSMSSTGYTSVFLSNVNQADIVGATASNSTTGSGATITTDAPLATNEGDMVIVGVTNGNVGSYTLNNSFIEGADHTFGGTTGGTAAGGYKNATGAAETPSATYIGTSNRQAIIGLVVQTGAIVDEPPANPTGLTATAGNNLVSLDWDDNTEPDLAGYDVYRSEIQGSGYSKINASVVIDSDYIDYTAENWNTYYYVVKAVDIGSNESGYSNEASATPDFQNCDDVIAGGYGFVSDLTGNCYVDTEDLAIIVQ